MIKVGLLFTSQDRYELMRLSLETAVRDINKQELDLTVLWLDGSTDFNAKNYFKKVQFANINLIKKSGFKNYGPATVTQIGMNLLNKTGDFDWIGMFESDCFFKDNWLTESLKIAELAKHDGLRVGVINPYSISGWTIKSKSKYFINDTVGATCCLFTPKAWSFIPSASIAHPFRKKLLKKLAINPLKHPSTELGWDWIFSVAAYHGGGYITISPIKTLLLNCGNSDEVKKIPPFLTYNDEFSKQKIKKDIEIKNDFTKWKIVEKKLLKQSLISIFEKIDLSLSNHILFKLDNNWYKRESNNDSWWIWSRGNAEISFYNYSKNDVSTSIKLKSIIIKKSQVIKILFNSNIIGKLNYKNNQLLSSNVLIKKGENKLRFMTKTPGKSYGSDKRVLAFAIHKQLDLKIK